MVLLPSKKTRPDLRAMDAAPPLLGAHALLSMSAGPPVEVVNPDGAAAILLICEHASNSIPGSLGDLGLDAEARHSHIAWDPGAEVVARLMSKALNAPLILQRFSRLVYDCNRPPEAPGAMPTRSEIFDIPGNANLTAADRQARTEALYVPFHQAITDHLDCALAAGRQPAIVTIHSFTSIFHGKPRTVELGLLHDTDRRLADAMLDLNEHRSDANARSDADARSDVDVRPDIDVRPEVGVQPDVGARLKVRRNQPYGPEDGVTHTLQRHALPRGLLNVMIEIRNDLILDRAGQAEIGTDLARMVSRALDCLGRSGEALKRQASS